jgi:thioredoxin-dependent peroxiredoxin
MNAYRDQYAQLFRTGRDIVLIAISNDADTTQAAWARESEFPFLFAADSGLVVSRQYGAIGSRGTSSNRNLFVVGPDGRIAWRATPFREVDPQAYVDLRQALERIVPRDSSGSGH